MQSKTDTNDDAIGLHLRQTASPSLLLAAQSLAGTPHGDRGRAHWGTGYTTDLQGIRRIAPGIVQDPAINSGRPIIEGTRVFVDRIIGNLEHGMSSGEICHEYELTPEQMMAVKQLSQEQVQYIKGYTDAL